MQDAHAVVSLPVATTLAEIGAAHIELSQWDAALARHEQELDVLYKIYLRDTLLAAGPAAIEPFDVWYQPGLSGKWPMVDGGLPVVCRWFAGGCLWLPVVDGGLLVVAGGRCRLCPHLGPDPSPNPILVFFF